MKVHHLGLWVRDLEAMKDFYQKALGAQVSEKYHNPTTGFTSYFLSGFGETRLELMHKNTQLESPKDQSLGWAHLAFGMGSPKALDEKIPHLETLGAKKLRGPRTTGDGYYECLLQDPEGNLIELVGE